MAEQIVIDVAVKTDEVKTKLAAAITAMNDYKNAQKQLNATIAEQGYATKEQAAELAEVQKQLDASKREVKSYTAALQIEGQTTIDTNASLDEQRQALNTLQKAYSQLSGDAKKAADMAGGLRDQIKEASDRVKEQEMALGDARRNVGSYTESILKALPGFNRFGNALNRMPGAAQAASGGIGGMTKAAMKFIATPVGAIIAAIVVAVKALMAAFDKLKQAIKQNDDASTGLARLYATTVQPILDAITAVFAKLADWIGKAASKLADFFGGFSKSGSEADKYVKALDNLEEAERQYTENSAKRERDISELKAKSMQTEKYNAAERRKFVEQAIALEKANLEEQKKITAEKLRLLELEAKRTKDSSDEMKNKIAEARAEMYRAEQSYYDGTRKLEKQLNDFDKAEQDARAERARKIREQRERDAKTLADQREKMSMRYMSDLQVELMNLQKAMNEELKIKGLTEEEKDEIAAYYNDLATQRSNEYAAAEKQRADEAAAATKAAEEAKIEARKQARVEFGLDPEKSPEEAELEKLQAARDADLLNEEEYQIAKATIEKKYSDASQKEQEKQFRKTVEMWASVTNNISGAMGSLFGGISEMFDEFGKENEDAAKASKAFGIMGVIAGQAQAIANTVAATTKAIEAAINAAASTGIAAPFTTPVFIAEMTAIVAGAAASAMSGIIQAKQLLSGGKFATGGIVPGTSYTGDNVAARVNSGEMILNRDQQTRLFDALSGTANNNSLGFNYDMMAAAMAAQPAPVVVYTELQEFGQKVTTYNEIASV